MLGVQVFFTILIACSVLTFIENYSKLNRYLIELTLKSGNYILILF